MPAPDDGAILEDKDSVRAVPETRHHAIHVFFDDMRPFHALPAGADRHETTHLCGPDLYEVAYDFTGWPRWRAVWRVGGPRKDYTMTSDYEPEQC